MATLPKPANSVADVEAGVAVAVTPVVVLLALMASASVRALLVVLSVAMAVPLIVSEPLLMPSRATVPFSVVPAWPKPPLTLPNWNEIVVFAPVPMDDLLLAVPSVISVWLWASWETLTL